MKDKRKTTLIQILVLILVIGIMALAIYVDYAFNSPVLPLHTRTCIEGYTTIGTQTGPC